MKHLMENFREFLTEDKARKNIYDQGGVIPLYHYATPDADSLVLDPHYKRGSYSTREYEVADTPRVFFYVDPDHQERFFLNRKLYKVDVPTDRVYDLGEDPEDFIEQVKHPVYGLRKGEEWNTLLETIREKYDGVFYDTGRLHIVVWFRPIEVQRAEEER
jgi:hypothetical protein